MNEYSRNKTWFEHKYALQLIIRRNGSGASDSPYSYTFLRGVVCLSVVCHIRAPA